MTVEPPVARFDGWELDLSSRELRRDGRAAVRLAEKPFRVLETLVTRPGAVVTRRELVQTLWPDGTTVDFDNNLNTAVAALRDVLEDSARSPRVIETIPRRGYRLIAPVRPAHPRPRVRRAPLAAVAFGACAVAAVFLVGASIIIRTGSHSRSATSARPSHDDGAHRAFLRGSYLAAGATRERLERSFDAYREAAELDPDFAEARAAAADVAARLAFQDPQRMKAYLEQAREEARSAIALDDQLPAAHRALALAALHIDWDFEGARRALERALHVAPNDAHAHLALASYHSALSHHDDAIAAARRAAALDPASLLVISDLGFFYLAAGRYEEALGASRESLTLEPGFAPALRVIVTAATRLERHDEAAEAAAELLRRGGAPVGPLASTSSAEVVAHFRAWDLARLEALGDEISPLTRALCYAAASRDERALDLLEESFDRHEGFLVFLTGYPQLFELRSHPRFRALAARIGLNLSDEQA